MYNSLYSLGEGCLSIAAANFVVVGEGIGVDLREGEDSCALYGALYLSIGVRNRLSYMMTNRVADPAKKSGRLYSAWTNIGDDYYFSVGDG